MWVRRRRDATNDETGCLLLTGREKLLARPALVTAKQVLAVEIGPCGEVAFALPEQPKDIPLCGDYFFKSGCHEYLNLMNSKTPCSEPLRAVLRRTNVPVDLRGAFRFAASGYTAD